MNRHPLLPALAILALSTAASAAASPVTMKWTVAGVERQALVFAPSVAGARAPLVFAFHGHGGNMHEAAATMRIQTVWPEAVVVYMQGLPTVSKVDPLGRQPGWQHDSGELGDRDLRFFDAVLASLRAKYPVDDRRVYATGFSNGGFFSYLLWAARGGALTAFAPCAGRIWPTLHLSDPKPLLQIAGEADPLVALASVEQTVATVRALDGATGPGAACGPGCTLYPSSKNAPVEVIVHPGGHVYPPWAPAKIVEFFKAHAAGG
jgi:polyhydroxybutyrate depolymerase